MKAAWYEANKDRVNQNRRTRYSNDPELRAKIAKQKREYRARNRDHRNAWAREYRARTWLKRRLWMYGLSEDAWHGMMDRQGYSCANPGCDVVFDDGGKSGHIDHDHQCCETTPTCGRCVRGLLCLGCNLALGHLKDDAERLTGLVDYLMLRGVV